MTSQTPKIAVLMTCYNRVATTLCCLERLFENATADLDVWLVDDGSSDGTGARILERFPSVNVIQGTGNLYWARGMRLAWERAVESREHYDYFLWLNDDVFLRSDGIERLMADASICGSECGVVVGTCSEDDSEKTTSYGATDVNDVRYSPNGTTPTKATGWFNGNVVLIPYGAYNRVGIISGDYSHSRADYDYAERLKRNGIAFFASSKFVGGCSRYKNISARSQNFFSRLRMFVEPGNCNVRDLWLFRRRYWGSFRAFISVAHMMVSVFLARPQKRSRRESQAKYL